MSPEVRLILPLTSEFKTFSFLRASSSVVQLLDRQDQPAL